MINPIRRRACRARSGSGCARSTHDAAIVDAAVILPGDQPRVRAGGHPGPRGRRRRTRPERRSSSRATPTTARPNPILARRSIWRLADELAGRSRLRAGPGRRIPSSSGTSASTARTPTSTPPRTSTARGSRRSRPAMYREAMTTATADRPRGRLGRARPRQPRAGRAVPRDPRPRLLRPRLLAVRRRPAADRGGGARRPARASPSRASAGSTSAPAPGATRCRWRSRVARGHRRRAVGRRCATRCGPAGGARAREPPDRRRAPGRTALERARRAAGRRRRVHRPRRLRHRGDRPVPRRDGAGRGAAVRGDADGPQPGIGRRPVLAARPRRWTVSRCRPCRSSWSSSARAAATPSRPAVERAPRTFDSFDGLADVPPPPAVHRRGRREGARFRAALAATGPRADDDGWTLARPAGRLDRDRDLVAPLKRGPYGFAAPRRQVGSRGHCLNSFWSRRAPT